jgi:hypothetical protein
VLELSPLEPDLYQQARDELWALWPKHRRPSRAEMLATLHRNVPKNCNHGARLAEIVAWAKDYLDWADPAFVPEFPKYMRQTKDGPKVRPPDPKPKHDELEDL